MRRDGKCGADNATFACNTDWNTNIATCEGFEDGDGNDYGINEVTTMVYPSTNIRLPRSDTEICV